MQCVRVGGGSRKKDTWQTKHGIFFLAVDQERLQLYKYVAGNL